MFRKVLKTGIMVTALMGTVETANAQNVKVYQMAKDKNIERGMKAIANKDFERASHHLWKAAKSNQAKALKASLYNNVCAVDFVLGRYDTALMACDASLKLNKLNWQALINRGNIYRNTGEYDLAKRDYQKVEKIRPNEPMLKEAWAVMARMESPAHDAKLLAENDN